jgi:hypothetical protein
MADLPPEIREIFKELEEQVQWLWACLTVYTDIFYGPKEQSRMLEEAAGTAFIVLGKALWSEMLMLMSRLTDPSGHRSKERLCFERLYSEIRSIDKDLGRKLKKAFAEIKGMREPLEGFRNTHLAHFDLNYAKSGALRRYVIDPGMVKKALNLFREFLITVVKHYHPGSKPTYEASLADGGDDLIAVLEDGMAFRELKKKKL